MRMADIGEHYAEPHELYKALMDLYVDVDHWSRCEPRADAGVALNGMLSYFATSSSRTAKC